MSIVPLIGPFFGKRHPARHRFHKYWARKPANVIQQHIQHYTSKGDLVLDPFSGSGVAIIEGFLLGRRSIGVDINPAACKIPKALLTELSTHELQEAFQQVQAQVGPFISRIFSAKCPDCLKKAQVRYWVCSSVLVCRKCHQKKLAGTFEPERNSKVTCDSCNERLFLSEAESDRALRVSLDCRRCNTSGLLYDCMEEKKIARSGRRFIANKRIMSYPKKRTGWLYTKENWRCLNRLKKAINGLDDTVKDVFQMLLSSTAPMVSRMIPYRSNLKTGGPAWTVPGFWIPALHIQFNVWRIFTRRFKRFIIGLEDLQQYPAEREKHKPIIYNGNSTSLRVKDGTVDYVITDPPYGDSVPYLEFSQIWNYWTDSTPDYTAEVIISNAKKRKKDVADYEKLLRQSFAEIGRVLKDGKWATVFFQNRDFSVWNILRKATLHAGLTLRAVSLHYPAVISAKAQLAREGTLTGDLVLQFQKVSCQRTRLCTTNVELNRRIEEIILESTEAAKGTKNRFNVVASMVLVKMWEENLGFPEGDLGEQIKKACHLK